MKRRIGIVGGGIIGLALAYKLSKSSDYQVTLFEKEMEVGKHQSGRNSGVLHCGLSYQPGSLKAKLAKNGIEQMKLFCSTHGVPFDICGKIVVASNNIEEYFLNQLAEKGRKNGLKGLKFLDQNQVLKKEPNIRATKCLFVPEEGIVDFKMVMKKMALSIKNNNGEIRCGIEIRKINDQHNEILISDDKKDYVFDMIINAGGLHSDKLFYKFTGNRRPIRIIPFRGEYFKFKDRYSNVFNNLVYPVANPKFPFLGVHFTRMINGSKEVGPNAVLALKREGYDKLNFNFNDLVDTLSYSGLFNFIRNNFKFTFQEFVSSLSIESFVEKGRKLIPDLKKEMLDIGISGVRAQAIDGKGDLLMDFFVVRKNNQIHLLNTPSPGATASLSIADYIIKHYI